MLSRISKISVFSILALMLAFGMATDALAAPKTANVTAGNVDNLRATDETDGSNIQHITFTVTPQSGGDAAGKVSIEIPSGWNRPFYQNSGTTVDTLNEAGEVHIDDGTATADDASTGSISGRKLVADFGKGSNADSVTFTYKSKLPARALTYSFPVTGNATETGLQKRGGRLYLDITVGPVRSGKGEFTVSGIGSYKQPDADPLKTDKGKYFLTSKESLAGLTFTFKAAGTMIKDSTIAITGAGGWPNFYPGPAGSAAGKVTVTGSGATLDETGSTTTKVVVKISADRIEAGHAISIKIDGLEAPEIKGTTAYNVERIFTPASASKLNADDSASEASFSVFTFITTSVHGSGAIAMNATQASGDPDTRTASPISFASSKEKVGNLDFVITNMSGFYKTGKIEITIPAEFKPDPYKTFGADPTAAGTVKLSSGSSHKLALSGRTITVTLNADISDDSETVTYNGDIEVPEVQGVYTFTTKTSSGPHGALKEITGPTIEVVGANGIGTMVLTKGGSPFTQTSSKAEVGNLVFTYVPGGRMGKGSQVEVALPTGENWSVFRTDNGDGIADRGEVTVSGKASLAVAGGGASFTATTTESLTTADKLTFTYKNVQVAETATPESHTFVTRTTSHTGATAPYGTLKEIAASPNVGIGRAPDGSGTIALSKTEADAGSAIGDLAITYTAAGKMTAGASVKITIPSTGDWPAPSTDVSKPGGVTLGGSISGIIPVVTDTSMSATITSDLTKDSTIVFTYKDITAPTAGGQYTFTAESKSAGIGTLTSLSAGATIRVAEVSAGSMALASASGSLTHADPGMALGNLNFTFTAGAKMAKGAQVQITIPTGWTTPFLDNNDGVDAAGESSVAGSADLSVSGGGGQPWMLTATTTAALEVGNTLTISYKQVTAPTAEAVYTFRTKSNVATGGTLLSISAEPIVIVRASVTAIAIKADPAIVFSGDEVDLDVSLWAGEAEGRALGEVVVMLESSSETGSFTDADGNTITSVTIADNKHNATATFSDKTAGTVTITATSGDMPATADVEVKSTIRDLAVDNKLVKQGATIMVSATGKAGGGTVTVLDAEDEKVGTTKALDPIGDVDADGDQEYSRSITLPAVLADGTYTISITIQGDTNSLTVDVVNDQTAPSLTRANAAPSTVMKGDQLTLSVRVAMNESNVPIESVTANVSALDSTQDDAVVLTELKSAPGTYTTIITVSADNTAEDGAKTVTLTATDEIGNSNTADVMVTLENDPSRIDTVSVAPAEVRPGDTVTVTMMGTSGGTATFTVTAADGAVSNGNGAMDEPNGDAAMSNGNGNGANGASNGADGASNGAASNGNGADDASNGAASNGNGANGNGMPMTEGPAGTYTGSFVVKADTYPEGTYDVTVNLGNKSMTVAGAVTVGPADYTFKLSIPPDAASVFVGEEVSLNITLAADAVGDVVVMLESSSATSVLPKSVTVADGTNSAKATFSDTSAGMVTITATSNELTDEVTVEVKRAISNLQVKVADELVNAMNPVKAGDTITVSATGKEGKATVTVTNAAGDPVVPAKGLTGLDEEPDAEGNIAYTRSIDLPAADVPDGMYTVTVSIAGATADMAIEVINDQSPPVLSNQKVLPDTVASGSVMTLSIDVSSNVPDPESELSVSADVSAIDAGADSVPLLKQSGTGSTYAAIHVVQNSDPADDGEKTITFTATDRIGGASTMTATTSLRNDVTPPALSDASAMPSPVVNGMDVTISVSSESGLTVTADASAIGGDAAEALSEGMDADMVGTGMYSSEPITTSVAASGDQTVTIKAVDGSGNEATMDVTVTVEVHEVTSVTFSPAQVGTGDTVMVTAMGTAGLTAMFNVFDADGMNIVDGKSMDESTDGGTYTGSFTVVADVHPAGEYWVSASIGTADAMTADGSLTIEHQKRFTLLIPKGTHAIHIPLDVDGIETVGDLYDALGDAVNFIITLGADGNWVSYLGDSSKNTAADAAIGDDTGLIAVMSDAATLELVGDALGTDGTSTVSVGVGNNLVGVPLDPAVDMMISDALVAGVEAIAFSNTAGDGFHTITAAGDAGDGPLMGGKGYIVVASAAGSIPIVGSAWENEGAAAAPAVVFSGSQTPVLHVDGGVMDEFDMLAQVPELRVTVKNLSTGASLDTVLGTEASGTSYSATFVEFGRHAAKAGDVLEITAHSPNPYVGVRPVPQIVVSAEEVLTSRISLPDLELYEIPSETELLANYPNPFNPETWIPYRLAKAAEVTLKIYDTNGRLVRSIDVGFKPAAVYESRASAIYWDGRNNYGERVASGTYFYHLTAGEDYASTRRMVILK